MTAQNIETSQSPKSLTLRPKKKEHMGMNICVCLFISHQTLKMITIMRIESRNRVFMCTWIIVLELDGGTDGHTDRQTGGFCPSMIYQNVCVSYQVYTCSISKYILFVTSYCIFLFRVSCSYTF